jgi:hypothetical protein
MKPFVLFSFSILFFTIKGNAQADAQRQQNAEYKRLSEATQRAFAVPDRPGSSSTYQSSVSSSSSSSSSSNSSSSVSSVSFFEHDNYSWADYSNINRINKSKAKNELANNQRERVWNAKEAKVEECYKMIEKKRENYQRIMQCAVSKGLDYYDAMKIVGFDENDFWSRVSPYKSSGTLYFKGSKKSDCQGDCAETLDYNDGDAVYVGNTKNGTANGKGTLTYKNGVIVIAEFYEGDIVGNIICKYPKGDVYEGEKDEKDKVVHGKFIYASGRIAEGIFINNKLNGWARVTDSIGHSTGYYKDGKQEKKGERFIEYKNGQKKIINYDYPERTRIIYSNGTAFTGLLDEKQQLKNGRLDYNKLTSFTGEFKNNNPYKGILETENAIFDGIFNTKGNNLLVGRTTDKKNKTISESFFDEQGRKNGYRIDYLGINKVNEAIYKNDTNAGPIRFTTKTGAILIGITGYKDYDLYGLLKNMDGTLTLGALQKGAWITLPETERENVMKVFNETNIALKNGRGEYETALK